jgi:hypothetical protein
MAPSVSVFGDFSHPGDTKKEKPVQKIKRRFWEKKLPKVATS